MFNLNKLFTISFFSQKVLYSKNYNIDLNSFIILIRQCIFYKIQASPSYIENSYIDTLITSTNTFTKTEELSYGKNTSYLVSEIFRLNLNRPKIFLNLWLKLRFEMTSKLITLRNSIYLYIRQDTENKLRYTYKKYMNKPLQLPLYMRGNFINYLNSLNILPKSLSLYMNKYFLLCLWHRSIIIIVTHIRRSRAKVYTNIYTTTYNNYINRLIISIIYTQELLTIYLPTYLKLFHSNSFNLILYLSMTENGEREMKNVPNSRTRTNQLGLGKWLYLLRKVYSSSLMKLENLHRPSILTVSNSRWSLELNSVNPEKNNRVIYQYLIKDSFLGAYSLISLYKSSTKHVDQNISLNNLYRLYSTNSFKSYRARPSISSWLKEKKKDTANLTRPAKIKGKTVRKIKENFTRPDKEVGEGINLIKFEKERENFIEEWNNKWLKKLRYLEIFTSTNYKLDNNEKLLLNILKERNYNLNKKMYQIPPVKGKMLGETVESLSELFTTTAHDLESIINNTIRSIVKNTANKKKHCFANYTKKFSAVGKSNDLLKNQLIQYKFNRSNANANASAHANANAESIFSRRKVWKESYEIKQTEKFSALPSLFEILNESWPIEVEQLSSTTNNMTIESKKISYIKDVLLSSPFFDKDIKNKQMSLFSSVGKIKKNTILIENLYLPIPMLGGATEKNRKVLEFMATNIVDTNNNNNSHCPKPEAEVDLKKEATAGSPHLKEVGKKNDIENERVSVWKIKEFPIFSNLNWKHKSLSLPLFMTKQNNLSFFMPSFGAQDAYIDGQRISPEALSSVPFITQNKTYLWAGHERIDIISLENLLKSFFKKMYSLISLPVLEYLPNKLNVRLFYYLKKNAKTYYSSTNIINSNVRSILGINLKLSSASRNSIFNNSQDLDKYQDQEIDLAEGSEDALEVPKKKFLLLKTNTAVQIEKKEDRNLIINKISNSYFNLFSFTIPFFKTQKENQTKINSLIHELSKNRKLRKQSMKLISLKYYWSNILNPSVKLRDYYTDLNSLNNLYLEDYSNYIDTLLTESNTLKLKLLSKWRGYNRYKDFNKKVSAHGAHGLGDFRSLPNEMTIKETILFSNPLLKEILYTQSLISPYNIEKPIINERLALLSGTSLETIGKKTKNMHNFNKAVQSIGKFGSRKKQLLSPIKLWEDLVPKKLKTLKESYAKYEISENSILKNIFTSTHNLGKLNLILFLVRCTPFLTDVNEINNNLPLSLRNRLKTSRNLPLHILTSSRRNVSPWTNSNTNNQSLNFIYQNMNKELNYKLSDTKSLLDLGEIYQNIRKLSKMKEIKLFETSGINILSSNYRRIDREIDSPNNNDRKGLVHSNKNLFKKLLVFLKLIFNKEIELDLTRIQNPYNEIHILNQILGEVIKYKNSFYKLIQIIKNYALSHTVTGKSNFMSEIYTHTPASKNLYSSKISYLHSILVNSINNSKFALLNSPDIQTSLGRGDLTLQRGREFLAQQKREVAPHPIDMERLRDIDKYIFSYNLIALDKWSNFNQSDKNKMIDEEIDLNLKDIELKNKLLNEREMDIDINNDKNREKNSNREKYIYTNRGGITVESSAIIEGEIISDTTVEGTLDKQGETKFIGWLNMRNSLNSIKGISSNLFYFKPDELTKTPIACSTQPGLTKIKDNATPTHKPEKSPNLATIFTIDQRPSNLELNKINKLMTYKMQSQMSSPLIIEWNDIIRRNMPANKPLMNFSYSGDAKLALSSHDVGKKRNTINRGFYSILTDKNIFSYTPMPTSMFPAIPINNTFRDQEMDILENNLNTEKKNLVNSQISGIKIKLGGRLEKTISVPRKSSQVYSMGHMSRGSTSVKNTSKLTYKNKKGSYSITVTTSYLSHREKN